MQVLDYITNGPLCQPGGMAVQKQPSGKRSRSQQGEEDLDDEEDEENEEAMGAAEQQLLSAPDGSKPKRHGGGNTRARAAWLLQNFKAELGKLAAAHTAGRVDLTFAPNSLTELAPIVADKDSSLHGLWADGTVDERVQARLIGWSGQGGYYSLYSLLHYFQ